jgi:hypothetical protein
LVEEVDTSQEDQAVQHEALFHQATIKSNITLVQVSRPLRLRSSHLGAGHADETRLEVEEQDAVQRHGVLYAPAELAEAGAEGVRHVANSSCVFSSEGADPKIAFFVICDAKLKCLVAILGMTAARRKGAECEGVACEHALGQQPLQLYGYLWSKASADRDGSGKQAFSFALADTIVFKRQKLVKWLFTSKQERGKVRCRCRHITTAPSK